MCLPTPLSWLEALPERLKFQTEESSNTEIQTWKRSKKQGAGEGRWAQEVAESSANDDRENRC